VSGRKVGIRPTGGFRARGGKKARESVKGRNWRPFERKFCRASKKKAVLEEDGGPREVDIFVVPGSREG